MPERRDRSPAARIGAFTTEPELPKSKARRLDRGSQYAIVAARQCLADAGYAMAGREERTGILLGTGSAGAGPLTEFERQMAESPESASPFLFPNTVANAPASQAAIELGIKGPNVTITQKDPAPLNALFYGRMLLADGRADALLVGAADEWNLDYHLAYERVRATRTATRPGFVLGEGAALILVEDEDGRALPRGADLRARRVRRVPRRARLAAAAARGPGDARGGHERRARARPESRPARSGSSTSRGTAFRRRTRPRRRLSPPSSASRSRPSSRSRKRSERTRRSARSSSPSPPTRCGRRPPSAPSS